MMTERTLTPIELAQQALDQAIQRRHEAQWTLNDAKAASSKAVSQPQPSDAAGMELQRLDLQRLSDACTEAGTTWRARDIDVIEAREKLTRARRALESAHRKQHDARHAVTNWTERVSHAHTELLNAEQQLTQAQEALTQAETLVAVLQPSEVPLGLPTPAEPVYVPPAPAFSPPNQTLINQGRTIYLRDRERVNADGSPYTGPNDVRLVWPDERND